MLERIWQAITSFNRTPVVGTQRSLALNPLNTNGFTALSRQYDLEITELPVRNAQVARELIEMVEYCPEVATAINEISDSVWSSADGDDQGFAIAPTLNDNKTPVDPNVYRILQRLVDDVIGGTTLEPAAERILAYGDAFASIGVNTRKMRIEKVLFLPTWEMFRCEDNQGQLLGFEQRRYLANSETAIGFHPVQMAHFRYRQKVLYGRALFYESIGDWHGLKDATEDLANGSRAIGINPNVHIMPACEGEDYRKAYKEAYEQKRSRGIVTDFYLANGADLKKLANINPDLKPLIDNVMMRRCRIAMRSRVPLWLLALPMDGAREIAGQPAMAYARFINRVRMALTAGIKHMCDLELALNGIPREQWQYRIIWPRVYVNPYAEQLNPTEEGESNQSGIEDLDNRRVM